MDCTNEPHRDQSPDVDVLPPTTKGAETTNQPKLEPVALLTPVRRIELNTVALAPMAESQAVESLVVKEMKGVGAFYTPNLARALSFKGLIYQPDGEFESTYQILAQPLLSEPRIVGKSKVITFVPAFAWQPCELVIVPFKDTRLGMRVLQTLKSLEPRSQKIKVFVDWNDLKKRHVVHEQLLTPQECELVDSLKWPTRDELMGALQSAAYDNLDDLAAANVEIRTLLQSREVE